MKLGEAPKVDVDVVPSGSFEEVWTSLWALAEYLAEE